MNNVKYIKINPKLHKKIKEAAKKQKLPMTVYLEAKLTPEFLDKKVEFELRG